MRTKSNATPATILFLEERDAVKRHKTRGHEPSKKIEELKSSLPCLCDYVAKAGFSSELLSSFWQESLKQAVCLFFVRFLKLGEGATCRSSKLLGFLNESDSGIFRMKNTDFLGDPEIEKLIVCS